MSATPELWARSSRQRRSLLLYGVGGIVCVVALATALLRFRPIGVANRPISTGTVSAPSGVAGRGHAPVDLEAGLSAAGRTAIQQGKAAFERGDSAAGLHAFQKATETDPTVPVVHDFLGVAYLRSQRFDAAMAEFQAETRLAPTSATGWARIADVFYTQQRLPEAVRALEKAVQIEPDNAQIYYNLAMLYPQVLDLSKATMAFDHYLALEPKNHYAHYLHGSLLFKLARLDEAEKALKEAIRLEPRAGLYHFALAQLYLRRTPSPETNDLIVKELNQSSAPGPPNTATPEAAAVNYYLGLCYQRQGKWEEARKALTKSISMAPQAWAAQYALASVLGKLGRTAEAKQAEARFVQLRQAEDLRMQRTFYEQEIQRNPNRADVHYQLAVFLMRHGERAAALQALRSAQRCVTPGEAALRRDIQQRMAEWRRGQ